MRGVVWTVRSCCDVNAGDYQLSCCRSSWRDICVQSVCHCLSLCSLFDWRACLADRTHSRTLILLMCIITEGCCHAGIWPNGPALQPAYLSGCVVFWSADDQLFSANNHSSVMHHAVYMLLSSDLDLARLARRRYSVLTSYLVMVRVNPRAPWRPFALSGLYYSMLNADVRLGRSLGSWLWLLLGRFQLHFHSFVILFICSLFRHQMC